MRHHGVPCDLDGLIEMCGTKSVWTVDIAYVLARCSLDFTFHTTCTYVRPEYGREAFYRDDLDADAVRVNRLFSAAAQVVPARQRAAMSRAAVSRAVQRAARGIGESARLSAGRGLPAPTQRALCIRPARHVGASTAGGWVLVLTARSGAA
jgi:hypothetical protein